jgi:hypothetical protein
MTAFMGHLGEIGDKLLHEPNFNAMVRPLRDGAKDEFIHYGTHFTNMFMRSYKDRITTRRIHEENRLARLAQMQAAAFC